MWKLRLQDQPHPLVARLTGRFDKARCHSNHFLLSRLAVARDLSSAIAYLHEKRICHRDIKPDNIGFDSANQVKLFDFGLARTLPSSSHEENETTFRLTEMCGSLRYMAPEVMLGTPYNQGCDVYSFSIVLWEILTCQQAYSKFSQEDVFVNQVGQRHVRPMLCHSQGWQLANNKVCQDMLRAGWHGDLACRASMRDMQSKLEAEITRLQENCKEPNNNNKRSLGRS